jgi:hypothetical protein
MFERFSRSWALIRASASVLRKDTELLALPAVSGLATLLVALSFAAPFVLWAAGQPQAMEQGEVPPIWLLWGFLFYLVQYFVIFYFNTALVGAASIRLEGGDPTLRDGLRIANSRLSAIFGYAMVAATVGLLLRAIEERAGAVGKWVAGLLGVAWTVASFLVVPVLVHRGVGPMDALKESATLLKRTWGENVIGQGGIGVIFVLLHIAVWVAFTIPAIAAVGAKQPVLFFALIGLAIIVTLLLALVQAALSAVYSAALYRHASGLAVGSEFPPALLAGAFAPKSR